MGRESWGSSPEGGGEKGDARTRGGCLAHRNTRTALATAFRESTVAVPAGPICAARERHSPIRPMEGKLLQSDTQSPAATAPPYEVHVITSKRSFRRPRQWPDDKQLPPLGLPPRSSSTGSAAERRLSICSTNGTEYESVVVVGHAVGSDSVVYYLLEVKSWELPLETYVVRRRFNDFKKFHDALALHMPMERPRSSSAFDIGVSYSSLLCNPVATPDMSPLYSPPSRERSQSWLSDGDDHSTVDMSIPLPPSDLKPGVAYYNGSAALPMTTVKFTLSGRAWLPPLPSSGFATMFTTRHILVDARVKQFNRILAAVLSDSSRAVANELSLFIQENPGAQAGSYTSLAEYAAIDMPFTVERHARRRAVSMSKRALKDQLSSSSSSVQSTPVLS